MQHLIEKANTLMEALPYIRRFAGRTFVIKYGGHAMSDERLKESFALDVIMLKSLGINTVIVHGGGPQINETLKRYGIVSEFVRGMRVTDSETMGVVEMVLVGQVNKEVVGYLNQHGGKAVGLCGKDGSLLLSKKLLQELPGEDGTVEQVDIGYVGDVVKVNTDLIKTLEQGGYLPVIDSSVIRPCIWATLIFWISFLSLSSTPGVSVKRISFSALSAAATRPATTSALML